MADINLTITIPDAYVARFSNVVDFIWEGRTTESKVNWTKQKIIEDLKTKVLRAERHLSSIEEIDIT